MKNLKKGFAILLAVILVMGLMAGCAKKEAPAPAATTPAPAASTPAPAASTPAPAPAPAKADPIVISIAHESNPGESITIGVDKWAELVNERSNGEIEIKVYPSSQLGSKADVIENILMGEPIIQETDGSFLCEYGAPELAILSMPYVFDTWDQAWQVIGTDWFAEQQKLLEAKGLHIVCANWALGERELVTTKPVYKVSDLKGLKIRVPNNKLSVTEFECFGATPTPMALAEVYAAVQQGVVDGQENPISYLYNAGYYEVCDYLTLSGHSKMPIQYVCGLDLWNSLTPDQQKILVEAGEEAGKLNNDLCFGSEADYAQKFRDAGTTVIELDDAALQGFKDAIVPLYSNQDIIGTWSNQNLYQELRDLFK